MAPEKDFWKTNAHAKLVASVPGCRSTLLRTLLGDEARCNNFIVDCGELGILDFTREKITPEIFAHLFELAIERGLGDKIKAMFEGEKINSTEHRAVLHVALRSHKSDQYLESGKNVVPDVHAVLDRVADFSKSVRSGKHVGATGKELRDVVSIGIGGSYLGPEYLFEAFRTDEACASAAHGRRLHFLANVDPIDVSRALEGFEPETTLVIIVSKTFTTAETMLNARTVRTWLLEGIKGASQADVIRQHMVAVSTNLAATKEFGIAPENVFGFWDWVGGRFSVCSAVGCLPLALQYGFAPVRDFLDGCRAMDLHFKSEKLDRNLPVLMGLISIWNSTYLGFGNVAVLPYCQALTRFAAHIQQVLMESNGKSVTLGGSKVMLPCGEIYFGEPGTNGQHSFYQLLHQGRVVPAEFIGFCKSQDGCNRKEKTSPPAGTHALTNHDELMCNFFAQPDALALGKSAEQLTKEGVAAALVPHKEFSGDRPSLSLLFPGACSPYSAGLLLSLYEHRTAVQGFVWGINSFDQWGVELGKVLAKNVRSVLEKRETSTGPGAALPKPTQIMLGKYCKHNA